MIKKLLSILALLCMTVASAWAASFSTTPYSSNATLSSVTVSSDMTIIINSGVTVTVNNGLSVSSGKTLTVGGGGTLVVNGAGGSTAVSGNIIVQGATVRAYGGNGSNGYTGSTGSKASQGGTGGTGGTGGAAFSGAVVIYSGQIVAQGGTGGRGGTGGTGGESVTKPYGGAGGTGGRGGTGGTAFTSTLTIYGGNVDAIGGNAGSGGSGGAGGMGWYQASSGSSGSGGSAGSAFSNASNLIRMNTADTKMYSNAGHTTEVNTATGKTIYITAPNYIPSLTLSEATDNSGALTDNNGLLVPNVTLTRTLQTGGWNTFCVPFNLDTPTGWTVKELTGAELEDGSLTLTFGDATSIEAGKPYLVKVTSTVENPTFEWVTISSSTTPTTIDGVISFVPVMSPTALTLEDKSYLFVSGGNKLTWAGSGSSMYGFRAYFNILDNSISNARAFTMSFDDATGITTVLSDEPTTVSGIYTLDGRHIDGQPTQKGVYIVNGKKTIIK